MRRLLSHPWTLRLAAWGLGAVFVGAALSKIADPPGFAQAIHNYGLFPAWSLSPLALALPWLELWLGLALVLGPGRRSAALAALGLLLAFVAALGVNVARNHPVDCGCFGGGHTVGTVLDMKLRILEDLGLALLALRLLLPPRAEAP